MLFVFNCFSFSKLFIRLFFKQLLNKCVIIGFGTSAPEMVVSALAATQGNPGLALGNAYGSNITNIALIIGLVAIISPITVPAVRQRETVAS